MFNKEQQKGALAEKVTYLEQSPWDNLIDIQCGDFYPKTVSEAELKQICLDCLVEASCSYEFLCIADLFMYISETELALETYKKSEALVKEPDDYSYLAHSIIVCLHDKEWGIALLDQAVAQAKNKPDSSSYVVIAVAYSEALGDNIRARELFEIDESRAVLYTELEFLAKEVEERLHDTTWHDAIMSKAGLLASPVTFV